jgi:hypothetical protein
VDLSPLGVVAASGTLRAPEGVHLQHTWTDTGVVAAPVTNGAHVLHLSVALCVLNDTYREAAALALPIAGVRVEADGSFADDWSSTGITYRVTLDTAASAEDQTRLRDTVESLAEIPRAIRAGAPVTRLH